MKKRVQTRSSKADEGGAPSKTTRSSDEQVDTVADALERIEKREKPTADTDGTSSFDPVPNDGRTIVAGLDDERRLEIE